MSKFKNVQKAAEQAGLLAKAPTAPTSKSLPPLAGIDDVKIKTPEEAHAAIEQQRLADIEKDFQLEREQALFSPNQATVRYDIQHTSPDEFRRRLREQLVDPTYSNRAISDVDAADVYTDSIKMAYLEDIDFQERAGKALRSNPRIRARAEEWAKDSPYIDPETGLPRIFVHIDRQTDPTGRLRLIQFDDPKELGVHSGTNNAAIQATLKDTDTAAQQMKDFNDELAELAGFSDSPEGLLSFFADTTNNYLVQKFSKGMDIADPALWDDLEAELSSLLLDIGEDPNIASTFIARAKQLPTANSTPHLFRGKNGLYLEDNGGFGRGQVGNQLKNIFPEDEAQIAQLMGGGTAESNKNLQKFIESKGYDHVVYHNAVEDKGTLSIINWNEDLWVPLLDEKIVGSAPGAYAQQASSYILGMLGLGAGVQRGKDGA